MIVFMCRSAHDFVGEYDRLRHRLGPTDEPIFRSSCRLFLFFIGMTPNNLQGAPLTSRRSIRHSIQILSGGGSVRLCLLPLLLLLDCCCTVGGLGVPAIETRRLLLSGR
jgi:hypothetical protein